jgi:DNA-binding response OmpR family regulator
VTVCQDGGSALFLAGSETPDVVVLAARLPDVPVDIVSRVLHERLSAPILLAVGDGDAEALGDRLGQALVAGASEVIARPYTSGAGLDQLNACVDRLRAQREADARFSLGSLHIDVARFEARVNQRSLTLTVREFRILQYLMSNYDRVVSAEEVLAAVWGAAGETATTNTLAVHMGRLRRSVGEAVEITNIRGVGYRITPRIP